MSTFIGYGREDFTECGYTYIVYFQLLCDVCEPQLDVVPEVNKLLLYMIHTYGNELIQNTQLLRKNSEPVLECLKVIVMNNSIMHHVCTPPICSYLACSGTDFFLGRFTWYLNVERCTAILFPDVRSVYSTFCQKLGSCCSI